MFNLFGNRCPLESARKDWIEDRLGWLVSKLGRALFCTTPTVTGAKPVA